MATYNQGVFRTGTYGGGSGSDPLVPEPVSAQIIQELPTQSVLLQRAKSVPMSTKTNRLPVLDVLPVAYFVSGDTGLKQTSQQKWKGVTLVAEEIACIVPIPEAYLDDAQVPIWDEVRPRMTEAIGALIDGAGLFGVNRPSTWSTDIYSAAVAAGNVQVMGNGVDIAQDVAFLGEKLARQGFSIDGFASRPGFNWRLTSLRNSQNTPIYVPNLQGTPGGTLYGYALGEVDNGAWDATKAQLIAGDWDDALVGMRADISFKMFTEGVISDDSGKVVLNLMQQDAQAMRVTMRIAFATANPVTTLQPTSTARYPFYVLQSAGSAS
ncbi:phage major capsid protein [Kutzneria viridogrisea]|uniref:HK97 family phage major capsid protein n=1 Tax=Kutzneria viridogrisea TaxID=47990 RepID=A0ABR6BGB9_9PSEU|nr:HK97 family phage major capsid protein [Kutzneria viridogrisea]